MSDLISNFEGLDNAENAGGAPWFQIVLPQDIDTIPDVILNSINAAITLNSGALAYNMMATVGTVGWSETSEKVDGVDIYSSTFSWVIPKDRNDILTYAQTVNGKGVVAIVRDANGINRLMGTKDSPADFRRSVRKLGNIDGSDRNEHIYEITLTGMAPVPFYSIPTPLPVPLADFYSGDFYGGDFDT